MYTVIGIKPDGSESKPLAYPTLTGALKKLQDLIEADECEIAYGDTEERGVIMFTQYTVIPQHTAAHIARTTPSPPDEPAGGGPSLRLVR